MICNSIWLTSKGTWVHGEGLTLDMEVANPADGSNDDQLKVAIKQF